MTTVRELTNRHRAQQILLSQGTQKAVAQLWPLLKWDALDDTYPDLASRIETLVRRDRQDSAAIASMYLKLARQAAKVKGAQKVAMAPALDAGQFDASLRINSVVALKKAAANLTPADLALSNALSLSQGSMSRLVLNAGRDTVTQTTLRDNAIQGWVRVGNGECDWCQQYLDGEVHTVEGYDFEAHPNCKCTAEVSYF